MNTRYIARVITPIERSLINVLARYYQDDSVHFMTFDEKFIGFRAKIRESIMHSEYADTTHHPELECIATSMIKQALVMMSYRTTDTGEAMWQTPQSVKACKEVPEETANCEPYRTRPGKYKVAKNEVGSLVIHKSLILGKDGPPVGIYDRTFLQCLQIAGGYKEGSRVWIGMAAGSSQTVDKFIHIPEIIKAGKKNNENENENEEEEEEIDEEIDEEELYEISVNNPLYCSSNGMDVLFDSENDVPEDTMWPRSMKSVVFNKYSNIEENIIKERYKKAFGKDISNDWLPSATSYCKN